MQGSDTPESNEPTDSNGTERARNIATAGKKTNQPAFASDRVDEYSIILAHLLVNRADKGRAQCLEHAFMYPGNVQPAKLAKQRARRRRINPLDRV